MTSDAAEHVHDAFWFATTLHARSVSFAIRGVVL
jgi:hypothetical protein